MEGTLYYSRCFGMSPKDKHGFPNAQGLTAALEPETGHVLWLTTQAFTHGGCTVSGENGRLYLGGCYNRENGISCLDARNGSVIWRSLPIQAALLHVVTVGSKFLFVHAQYKNGLLLNKETGKVLKTLTQGYKCTRFTLSEPYLLASNMDIFDLSDIDNIKLVSTGPELDPSECVGALVSNGRLFYSCHAGSLQACAVRGAEARGQVVQADDVK